MCSFLFTNFTGFDVDSANFLIKKRGPDHTNVFVDAGKTYIHNLLSITGDFFVQPLADDFLNIMFNGEIYNYNQIGNFRSDVESIRHTYSSLEKNGLVNLDGEFSIFIYDKKKERYLLVTDTFGTKPLYYSIENSRIGVCSYPDPLKILGFSRSIRCNPNSILEIDANNLEIIEEVPLFKFDLTQHKESYEDWKSAFSRSIEKRVLNTPHDILLPLSSGYDSGLISCVLNQIRPDYISYTILGTENREVINSRILINKNSVKNIIESLDSDTVSEISQDFANNVQHFNYGPTPYEITHDGFNDPGAIGLYYILKDARIKYNTKIVLSGQGSDEIMSNIQTYGFNTKNPEKFQSDLESIFPWGNFYMGSQWSYLMKEECIAGSLGIETRYPFLDRDLVQEYLWLLPELKNREYKAPISDYLDELSYPYRKEKIGFNIR